MRTKDLFGNEDTAMTLCEYTEELSLLKAFLEIANEAVALNNALLCIFQ